jgi:3-phenylpropionate/trans-cinnamate dioxygenase ferredoxin subunit
MSEFLAVLAIGELADGSSRAVEVQGQSVLICRSGEQLHAVANRCSHQRRPLEGGRIRDRHITCPVHGVRFDLSSGKPLGSLTQVSIAVFPLRVMDGWIEVSVPPLPSGKPPETAPLIISA